MKYLYILLLLLSCVISYSQTTEGGDNNNNPRKLRLNQQTTSLGLDAFGEGFPDYTPVDRNDNWTYWDYTNDINYYYDGSRWVRVSISDVEDISSYTLDSSNYKYPIFNLADSTLYNYDYTVNKFVPLSGVYYISTNTTLDQAPKDVIVRRNDTSFVYVKLHGWMPLTPVETFEPITETFSNVTSSTITLSQTPRNPDNISVTRSGINMIQNQDYTISGNIITFTTPLEEENIFITYY